MGSASSTPVSTDASPTSLEHPFAMPAAAMSSENDYRAVSSHAQTMPLFDSQQAVTSGTEKRKGGERLYGNTRGQLAEERGKGRGQGLCPPI